MPEPCERLLIAIPAYNEQAIIADVVRGVRACLPEFDLLVIDDGSTDSTPGILTNLGVAVARHLCNLGYGRAIQTAIQYALQMNYDVLVTLDADGQHHPEQVRSLYRESSQVGWDLLIGSRYVQTRDYSSAPINRRIGMRLFFRCGEHSNWPRDLCLLLLAWVLNLIRKGRIYTGYCSALLVVIGGMICIASTPARVAEKFTQWIETAMPRSLAVLLAICCILVAFIFVLREITVISGRLRALTQQLAIELATRGGAFDPAPPETAQERGHLARLSGSSGA